MLPKIPSPKINMFSSTLIMSSMMVITASNWIMLWMSMELNLMSFIPMMMSSTKNYELSASTKYFLMQTISSLMMLTSIFLYSLSPMKSAHSMIFMVSIMIKMGAAPFHMWVPQVVNNISWTMVLLVVTWQKLGPLFLMAQTTYSWLKPMALLLIIMNSFTGTLAGINQTQMRPIIAYSSISHMAWLLMSAMHSTTLLTTYFLIYSITTYLTIMPMTKMNKITSSNLSLSMHLPSNMNSLIMINFLSMGGMPPLMGFIPKWIIITKLINSDPIPIVIMTMLSLASLLYYLKVLFASYINSNKSMNMKTIFMTPQVITIQIIFPMITLILLMYDKNNSLDL